MIEILVLCDDYWHPAEVIEMGLKPLESDEFHFTFVKSAKDILTPERIAKYPVIINCKMNQLNRANTTPWFDDVAEVGPDDLKAYVENGGGFISAHAGNTSKEGEPYTDFAGNYFVQHPPRCDVEVKVTAKHPVTEGVQDFVVRDEHYQIELTAKDADVFLKTYSADGGEQIGGYTREIGKGRLCVLTPGHILDVWLAPEFQKLLVNAIHYVC